MKILLTGAAGFIGMTTTLRLLARGDEVVGIDNLNDYYDVALKQSRLDRLLPQLTDAARSIRALADLLSRQPEALIKGRTNTGKE